MPTTWSTRFWLILAAAALAAAAADGASPVAGGKGVAAAAAAWAVQVLFALAVTAALAASQAWKGERALIADSGWPPLRSMAVLTPITVLGQVALGALYRHGALGALPHVVWAFAAGILVMMTGAFALAQAPGHLLLRRISIALISLVCLQVVLGVTAFVARLTGVEQSGWLAAAAAAHAATGALVLGSTCALGAQILRDVAPAAKEELAGCGRHS